MRTILCVVVLLTSRAYAGDPELERLTQTARNVARDGRCEALPDIGERVRFLDAEYYAHVFVIDPVIATCATIDPRWVAAGEPPALTPTTSVHARLPDPDRKNPTTALMSSLITTAAGGVLLGIAGKEQSGGLAAVGVAAIVIGPTVGHVYAGSAWNAALGVRIVSVLTGIVGAGMALSCIDGCRDESLASTGAAVFGLSALTYGAATIVEISTAYSAAEDHNRTLDAKLVVTPIATGTSMTPGIGLVGRF